MNCTCTCFRWHRKLTISRCGQLSRIKQRSCRSPFPKLTQSLNLFTNRKHFDNARAVISYFVRSKESRIATEIICGRLNEQSRRTIIKKNKRIFFYRSYVPTLGSCTVPRFICIFAHFFCRIVAIHIISECLCVCHDALRWTRRESCICFGSSV